QMRLVLDERFDRAEQGAVQLVRDTEIEEAALVAAGLLEVVDVKSTTEGDNLLRQLFRPDGNRLPVEALAGQRKDVAFFVAREPEHQRFVGAQQLPHLFALKRLRARQGGVFRKLV